MEQIETRAREEGEDFGFFLCSHCALNFMHGKGEERKQYWKEKEGYEKCQDGGAFFFRAGRGYRYVYFIANLLVSLPFYWQNATESEE